MLPIPVNRYLVPAVRPAAPPDAEIVDVPLATGLPFTLPLGADLTLVLSLPTGLATEWRGADPVAPVSHGAVEAEPRSAPARPIGDVGSGRLVLTLQRGTRPVAAAPLVSDYSVLVEPGDPASRRIDVWIIGWEVRAGTVRGPGEFGSRLQLAWRSADGSVMSFAPLPVNPAVVARTPPPPPETTGAAVRRLQPHERILLKLGRLAQARAIG